MDFYTQLKRWYIANKRDLPWRHTRNPYPIWLSEIILQQTRVAQGLPYYNRFIEAFPTVFDLASADEEQVLKLWQGLGYYSRARNMHATAKQLVAEYNGVFPKTAAALKKLKGIGDYTAAAIASFGYDEKIPVVDGNVFRVLSRIFLLDTDIAASGAKNEFATLSLSLMPEQEAALYNQAIMEFGALQCVPKNPDCLSCVFQNSCLAFRQNRVDTLPVKNKKTKVTVRYFNYLVFEDDHGRTLVQKRSEKGIWHNLYEFPLVETQESVSVESVRDMIQKEYQDFLIESVSWQEPEYIHKLSHQTLFIRFFRIKAQKLPNNALTFSAIHQFPFPIVIAKFLEKNKL